MVYLGLPIKTCDFPWLCQRTRWYLRVPWWILQVPTLFEGANGAKNAPGLTAAAPCCTHCEKGPVELGRRGLASTCLGKLDVTWCNQGKSWEKYDLTHAKSWKKRDVTMKHRCTLGYQPWTNHDLLMIHDGDVYIYINLWENWLENLFSICCHFHRGM